MTTTTDQLALVNRYLPTEAKTPEADGGYGWTDDFIVSLLVGGNLSPARVVRFFWYQRVQETAEYIDAGKGLTAIHQQARAMLDYWDTIIKTNPLGMEPAPDPTSSANKKPISFGEIEKPYETTNRWC